MQMLKYYGQLDAKTRTFVASAYVEAIRQLKTIDHPALSPRNAPETSRLICWRIVACSTQGVRNPLELTAYAIADICGQGRYRAVSANRVRCRDLKAARVEFEAIVLHYEHLSTHRSGSNGFHVAGLNPILKSALDNVSAAKSAYVRLLRMWGEKL